MDTTINKKVLSPHTYIEFDDEEETPPPYLSETELMTWAKERQKKDTHNQGMVPMPQTPPLVTMIP